MVRGIQRWFIIGNGNLLHNPVHIIHHIIPCGCYRQWLYHLTQNFCNGYGKCHSHNYRNNWCFSLRYRNSCLGSHSFSGYDQLVLGSQRWFITWNGNLLHNVFHIIHHNILCGCNGQWLYHWIENFGNGYCHGYTFNYRNN